MRAAYHTAQATTNSDSTHTQVGIDERASARRGSNGSSELNASMVKRTSPRRVEWGQAGHDDARPVMHIERNVFDTFVATLTLCTNHEPVRPVIETSGVEDDVGRQLLIDNRLRIAIEVNTNAGLIHDEHPYQRSSRRIAYLE